MKFFLNGKRNAVALLLILVIFVLSGCSSNTEDIQPISVTTLQFGTVIQVTVFQEKDVPAMEKVLSHMKTLEDELSTSIPTSVVSLFNEAPAGEAIQLTDHAKTVIEKGLYYSKVSNGKFDITIEPLVTLWGIGTETPQVPEPAQIEEALTYVGYDLVDFDPDKATLTKLKDNVKIDLGAIAKGYAADEAARILKEEGVTQALINLGGNVYALGSKGINPWKVGVQDPLQAQGAMVGIVKVENAAVITSGVYERYFEKDGIRYHHILSTEDGFPVNNEILGISIITDSAIDGDALSTLVYTMDLIEGMKFVESTQGVEAIFITRDSKIYLSSGAESIFEKSSEAFDLSTSATKK